MATNRLTGFFVLLALLGALPSDLWAQLDTYAVTEGRTLTLAMPEVPNSIYRWHVLSSDGASWVSLADDARFSGTQTSRLQVLQPTRAMNGTYFRALRETVDTQPFWMTMRMFVNEPLFPNITGIGFWGDDLVVADSTTHTVRLVSQVRMAVWGNDVVCGVSQLAGKEGEVGSTDGPLAAARFNHPAGIAPATTRANSVVCDSGNGTLRRLEQTAVSTFAGSSGERGNVDDTGAAARFAQPTGIDYDADGNHYVADRGNHTIRKVTAAGVVSTFAGSPGNAGWADGLGSAARFQNPTGIAVATDGTVFVTDTGNNVIRVITPAGQVSTHAGIPGVAGSRDGPGTEATFNGPTGIALGSKSFGSKFLYVADTGNSTIRRVYPDGKVETFVGIPGVAGFKDGTGYYYYDALLDHPEAVISDDTGIVIIGDTGNGAIRGISIYDGWLMTLQLRNDLNVVPVAIPPASSPNPIPPAPSGPSLPSPATPAPVATSGSGGGGCPSAWFLLAIAGLIGMRRLLAR